MSISSFLRLLNFITLKVTWSAPPTSVFRDVVFLHAPDAGEVQGHVCQIRVALSRRQRGLIAWQSPNFDNVPHSGSFRKL